MADMDRTEQPTAKRLEEARKKGQVPRSPELSAAAVVLITGAGLQMLGAQNSVELTADVRAQHLQPGTGDQDYRGGAELRRARYLALLAGFLEPFGCRLFCAVHVSHASGSQTGQTADQGYRVFHQPRET